MNEAGILSYLKEIREDLFKGKVIQAYKLLKWLIKTVEEGKE